MQQVQEQELLFLIKMLKSLRVDVLTVQKDKKASKAEGKTTPKDNSPVSEV